jgi:hypothetical protein
MNVLGRAADYDPRAKVNSLVLARYCSNQVSDCRQFIHGMPRESLIWLTP